MSWVEVGGGGCTVFLSVYLYPNTMTLPISISREEQLFLFLTTYLTNYNQTPSLTNTGG